MKSWFARFLRRLGLPPERTVYAVLASTANLVVFGSKHSQALRPSSSAIHLVQIDRVNHLAPKFVLDLPSVSRRLDVTGLRDAGVRIASDVRSLNRGNLVIGDSWTPAFEHRYVDPRAEASPEDYRYVTHETVRLMFIQQLPWSSTPEYRLFARQIEEGLRPYGLGNSAQLEKRGEDLVRLYESMSEKGYRSSSEMGGHHWDEAHFYLNPSGQICFGRHGNHRLAIAKLIGLVQVPAIFGGVHLRHAQSLTSDLSDLRSKVMRSLTAHPAVLGEV